MSRPSDECPYSRPFPADFKDCPAFQPRQFIPLDTLYQPLLPVLTCRHLITRSLPERARWYAACQLGDADARRRWADELGSQRLERIRDLQRRMGEVLAPYAVQLWKLKGMQLRALRDSEETAAIAGELSELAAKSMLAMNAFLEVNQAAFSAVDLPVLAARRLIRAALDDFIESRFASEISFEVPDDVLDQFPRSVRSFFRPSPAEMGGSRR